MLSKVLEHVVNSLEGLKANLMFAKERFEALPSYIKYYAISDFKSSTGMDFDGWLNEVDKMMGIVEMIKANPSKTYLSNIESFHANLLKLIDYLRGLKVKIDYLPPGLIPNIDEIIKKFSHMIEELEGLRGGLEQLKNLLQ